MKNSLSTEQQIKTKDSRFRCKWIIMAIIMREYKRSGNKSWCVGGVGHLNHVGKQSSGRVCAGSRGIREREARVHKTPRWHCCRSPAKDLRPRCTKRRVGGARIPRISCWCDSEIPAAAPALQREPAPRARLDRSVIDAKLRGLAAKLCSALSLSLLYSCLAIPWMSCSLCSPKLIFHHIQFFVIVRIHCSFMLYKLA